MKLIKSIVIKVIGITFSHWKLILRIGIPIFLIIFGTNHLISTGPEFLAQQAQFSFIIDKTGNGKIDSLFYFHSYYPDRSEIGLEISLQKSAPTVVQNRTRKWQL